MSGVGLAKSPTGIPGLDSITGGGLPLGRSTLLYGGAGTGKTLLGLEFLVRGALQYGEPGVLLTLEEDAGELGSNFAPLGFNLGNLIQTNMLEIDQVILEHGPVTGAFDLDGLFVRIEADLDRVKAKRMVLDSIDVLFMSLPNPALIREEIRRLLRWIKKRGITVMITAAGGEQCLSCEGMEEYVADCVIALENRVVQQCATRLLRIVKYRGSSHGSNEYPFLIGPSGISVLPITVLEPNAPISSERVSSGIPRLDTMLGGSGYYRGSTILVSGPAGGGKTSVAAKFVEAACARGERCLFFLLEEPAAQVMRNMRSIGSDLAKCLDQNLLRFSETRLHQYGQEEHLARFHQGVLDFTPSVVVFDPLSALLRPDDHGEFSSIVVRLLNFLKSKQITSLLTVSTGRECSSFAPELSVSSTIDSWVSLLDMESNGERTRILHIMKSRGMPHSNQMREFRLTAGGIELIDVYTGKGVVLTGTARAVQEAEEAALIRLQKNEAECLVRTLETKQHVKDAKIAALEAEFVAAQVDQEYLHLTNQLESLEEIKSSHKMAKARSADIHTEARPLPPNPEST